MLQPAVCLTTWTCTAIAHATINLQNWIVMLTNIPSAFAPWQSGRVLQQCPHHQLAQQERLAQKEQEKLPQKE